MSAIIERVECDGQTWYRLTTRGKGGATVWPACETLDGAQAKMAFWFNARG